MTLVATDDVSRRCGHTTNRIAGRVKDLDSVRLISDRNPSADIGADEIPRDNRTCISRAINENSRTRKSTGNHIPFGRIAASVGICPDARSLTILKTDVVGIVAKGRGPCQIGSDKIASDHIVDGVDWVATDGNSDIGITRNDISLNAVIQPVPIGADRISRSAFYDNSPVITATDKGTLPAQAVPDGIKFIGRLNLGLAKSPIVEADFIKSPRQSTCLLFRICVTQIRVSTQANNVSRVGRYAVQQTVHIHLHGFRRVITDHGDMVPCIQLQIGRRVSGGENPVDRVGIRDQCPFVRCLFPAESILARCINGFSQRALRDVAVAAQVPKQVFKVVETIEFHPGRHRHVVRSVERGMVTKIDVLVCRKLKAVSNKPVRRETSSVVKRPVIPANRIPGRVFASIIMHDACWAGILRCTNVVA